MSNPFEVQMEGVIEFATVDPVTGEPDAYVAYNDEIAALVINRTRNTVDRKPTYGDARTIKRAADLVETVKVNFVGDESNVTGVWALIWEALGTPPCTLAFRAVYKPGAVSATNPCFVGFVTVIDVDAGAPAAESKWLSKTWPAFGVDGPLAAYPV